MTGPVRTALALALLLATPAALAAQGADSLVRRADALLFAGDSASAFTLLERGVRDTPRDPRLWHRLGLLAWRSAQSHRNRGMIRDRRAIDRLRLADSALRTASVLAPADGRYELDLARFLRTSTTVTVRFSAARHFERALEAARRAGDSLLIAEAADEMGMIHWVRYEAVADRYQAAIGAPYPSWAEFQQYPGRLVDFLRANYSRPNEAPGTLDYTAAAVYFDEARRANPNHGRAQRHHFMVLAEKRRWEELALAAEGRLASTPWDAWAWLARGLATHRMGRYGEAAAAFDSALVFLSADDRERFTRLSRIVRPADSIRVDSLPPERRDQLARTYWVMSDPLWLTPGNEHRLEFLARVTYAELRWTSDDFGLRGADTDRGDIHIRYGPPDEIVGFAARDGAVNTVLWRYDSGLFFLFRAPPSYGTATMSLDFRELAERARATTPVRWDNLPVNRALDSIHVQVARFRAPGDSADVLVVAELPLGRLARGLDIAGAPVAVSFEVLDGSSRRLLRDSTSVAASGDSTATETRVWRRRTAGGGLVYRIEALQPDALRGARALGQAPPGDTAAFAMSDVLLAERVLPREGAAPRRWTDFHIAPSLGRFRRGQAVSLLWESYGLRARDGANRYRIAVRLERRKTGAERFVARVIGGVNEALGREARGRERASLSFERTVPASPVTVDFLSLDLGTAAPGRYTLAVEITDLVSGRTTTRESTVHVLP